jgi:cytochrome c peroxidase
LPNISLLLSFISLTYLDPLLSKNNDFNSFDKITFISEYVNPLSAQLTNIQKLSKIEPSNSLKPVSAHAETIFARDAFKAEYFAPAYALDFFA